MSRSAVAWIAAAALLSPGVAFAAESVSNDRVEALERRNAELEVNNQDLERRLEGIEQRERERTQNEDVHDLGAPLAEWARRVRISGSANTGYYRGTDESIFEDTGFQVWDARFFLDADLGRDVEVGDVPIARNVGFSFEWNLVRLGEFQDDQQVGETYVELQGLGGSSWANAQVGRFQIPVGENYLRFSKGYRNNPFITNTVGGPWWWDEGVRVYGSGAEGRLGYVASISDGETDIRTDSSREPQLTMKLWGRPLPWLYASVSGLRGGEIGNDDAFGSGALWLGETWATPVGAMGPIPTWQHGKIVPDAPRKIESTMLVGADLVLTPTGFGRFWFGAGRYTIDAAHSASYDRTLYYWIAEWVLDGDAISPELSPFYLAVRSNGLGTYDDDEGYLLDISDVARLGYNTQSIQAYSIALGWHLTRLTTLRLEYTRSRTELVDGVPRTIRNDAGDAEFFGIELGAFF
jgi:hypothetical protein